MHPAALPSSQQDAAVALPSAPDLACRAEASSSLIQEELAASLSQLMPLVYLLFFGLTGASLKLVRTTLKGPSVTPCILWYDPHTCLCCGTASHSCGLTCSLYSCSSQGQVPCLPGCVLQQMC